MTMTWDLFLESVKQGFMLPNMLNSLQWAMISFLCWLLLSLAAENRGLKEVVEEYEEEKGERK